jgi:hypothetical protein
VSLEKTSALKKRERLNTLNVMNSLYCKFIYIG